MLHTKTKNLNTVAVVFVVTLVVVLNFWKKFQSTEHPKVPMRMKMPNGTLVVMDSCNGIQDSIIRNFTLSKITHVGLVVRDAQDKPFLFHTTGKHGACLVPWDRWLGKNVPESRILVRFPSVNISSEDMEHAISGLYGTKYAYHLWKGVLKRWIRVELPGDDKHSMGIFCSELVCRVYENLGMLDFTTSDLTPSLVMPVHFSGDDLPFVGIDFSLEYEVT